MRRIISVLAILGMGFAPASFAASPSTPEDNSSDTLKHCAVPGDMVAHFAQIAPEGHIYAYDPFRNRLVKSTKSDDKTKSFATEWLNSYGSDDGRSFVYGAVDDPKIAHARRILSSQSFWHYSKVPTYRWAFVTDSDARSRLVSERTKGFLFDHSMPGDERLVIAKNINRVPHVHAYDDQRGEWDVLSFPDFGHVRLIHGRLTADAVEFVVFPGYRHKTKSAKLFRWEAGDSPKEIADWAVEDDPGDRYPYTTGLPVRKIFAAPDSGYFVATGGYLIYAKQEDKTIRDERYFDLPLAGIYTTFQRLSDGRLLVVKPHHPTTDSGGVFVVSRDTVEMRSDLARFTRNGSLDIDSAEKQDSDDKTVHWSYRGDHHCSATATDIDPIADSLRSKLLRTIGRNKKHLRVSAS